MVMCKRNGRFVRSQRCKGPRSVDRMAADGPKKYSSLEGVDARGLKAGRWWYCRWAVGFNQILVIWSWFSFDYFRKSFCFLVKICICRNRLGLVNLGYKYQLYGTEKNWYTSNTTTLYNFLQFTFLSATSLFSLFDEFFQLIKDVSHSSDLICW